jgi:hypothetical protein
MCTHEEKNCPRCGAGFECKGGSITECQCYGVELNNEERAFIEERYGDDCLCRSCLLELKNQYLLFKEKYFFK